jgi:hypothetical protein
MLFHPLRLVSLLTLGLNPNRSLLILASSVVSSSQISRRRTRLECNAYLFGSA